MPWRRRFAKRRLRTLHLRLIQNLNPRNRGVVHDWLEGEVQFSLGAWLHMAERLWQFAESPRLLENIEVVQQRLSVAHDLENAAANAPISRSTGAEVQFRKMQN